MGVKRERLEGSPTTYKSVIKLTPAIGDWTTMKPVRFPSKKVKTGLYGFDRLSQEDLKLAHTIHYNFAQALVSSMKADLSVGGDLFTVSAEQSSYADFLKRVYQPTVQCRMVITGISDEIAVCIDMPLANTIINHTLGGRDLNPITRKLTEIESDVLAKAFSAQLKNFVSAYEKVFEAPKFEVVSSPEMSLEGSQNPAGAFVFFSLELSLGDNPPGIVWMGYSSSALKTLLEGVRKRRGERPVNFSRLPQAVLSGINIPVIVDLGHTAVATMDLQGIGIGDVVSLDIGLSDPIEVMMGGRVKLVGQPGTKGGKLAVRTFGTKTSSLPKSSPGTLSTPRKPAAKPTKKEDLSLEKGGGQEYSMEEEEGVLEDEFPEEGNL